MNNIRYMPKPINNAELKTASLMVSNDVPQQFIIRQSCQFATDWSCATVAGGHYKQPV